jgi:hypothetical protein
VGDGWIGCTPSSQSAVAGISPLVTRSEMLKRFLTPWPQAIHGTAVSFGVPLPCLLSWPPWTALIKITLRLSYS